jgi:hypothetical protein
VKEDTTTRANPVAGIDEIRQQIPTFTKEYEAECELGTVADIDAEYARNQLPDSYLDDPTTPVLDQWYNAYKTAVSAPSRLSKEEFAVVAACLGGWAWATIIGGAGSRDMAWFAIDELCHLKPGELNDVFEAMDSITPVT